MTHLDYLQQNAEWKRGFPDGKFTIYKLKQGIAIYNNINNKYLWHRDPNG